MHDDPAKSVLTDDDLAKLEKKFKTMSKTQTQKDLEDVRAALTRVHAD